MSLFKNESPLLSRQASIAATVPNQSGGGNEPSSFNLIPTEYVVTVPMDAAGNAISKAVFISDDFYQVVGVKEVHATASTSGTVTIEKLTTTQAPGAGTALLTGTISNAGTANTVLSGTLIATISSLQMSPGDRLGVVCAGTQTNLVGGQVTIYLKRWQ
jgi:hypothetical protein